MIKPIDTDCARAGIAISRAARRNEVTGRSGRGAHREPDAADVGREQMADQHKTALQTPPDDSGVAESVPRLRSFGRRRARKLTARQSALLDQGLGRLVLDVSTPPPSVLTKLFDAPVQEVWLEIGFGDGEHLLWQAKNNPKVGIIGCEPFIDGVVKVIDGVERDGLQNVRLYDDDARDLMEWCPPGSVSRAFVLFPDPWPKKRHNKRRLVTPELLQQLARVMTDDGHLRLATDITDYARVMLLAVRQEGTFQWLARRPVDWRQRPLDWPPTKYERKAKREGRVGYFFCFDRQKSRKI